MQERYQGRSLNRLEDLRFLTGHGKYVANDHVPGVLHAHVVRSPVAFARIARLDLEAARAVPGVVAVYTEADLAADGIGELPCITVIEAVEPIVVPPRPALARGFVQACRRSRRLHHRGVAGGGDGGRRGGGRLL